MNSKILLALLSSSLLAFALAVMALNFLSAGEPGKSFTVTLDGREVLRATLSRDGEYPIRQPDGVAVAWNAMPGATGYYVCRRVGDGGFQIVADVSDTGYMDVNVFDDLKYTYQVYAHTASITSRSAVSVEARAIPPEAVSISAAGPVKLCMNATLQLGVVFEPANANAALTWDSSKDSVATVDAGGLVTPRKKGTTIISVRTDNGKAASVKVPKPVFVEII